MSAISYVFEDSVPYHNQDSMGTDLTITPGSLLWTWAGSGVVHHEVPTVEGGEVHGLQLFLDIPAANKTLPPKSIFIPREKMPIVSADGVAVKVAMGSTNNPADPNNPTNPIPTPEPITLLDITLTAGKGVDHQLPAGWNATIYLLSGTVILAPAAISLRQNEAIAFGASDSDETLTLTASTDSRFLLISGPIISGPTIR